MTQQFVLLVGSFGEGVEIHGIFDTPEEAETYADRHHFSEWEIMRLLKEKF